MIGRAVWECRRDRKASFLEEKDLEWMSDDGLRAFLFDSGRPFARQLTEQLRHRQLYKPALQARVLPTDQLNHSQHELRRRELNDSGMFDPAKRVELERQIALAAKVKPNTCLCTVRRPRPACRRWNSTLPKVLEHTRIAAPLRLVRQLSRLTIFVCGRRTFSYTLR